MQGGQDSIIVWEFSYGQKFWPIVLLVITVSPKVLLNDGINSFSLAIGLGVKGSLYFLLDAY